MPDRLWKALEELGNNLMLVKLTSEAQSLTLEEVEDARLLYVLLRNNKDAIETIRELRGKIDELKIKEAIVPEDQT